MAASITFIGLVAQTFILFLANYFFIKSARFATDKVSGLPKPSEQGNEGVGLLSNTVTNEEAEKTDRLKIGGAALAFVFGTTGREANQLRRFAGWRHIPYQGAIISTTTIILFFTIVFSNSFSAWLGIVPLVSSDPITGICSAGQSASQIAKLVSDMKSETNVEQARIQYQHSIRFLEALRQDTVLYGTRGYECDLAPRTKEAFRMSGEYGGGRGLQFFPGYCQAAQELALQDARSRLCERNVCRGGEVITGATAMNGEVRVNRLRSIGSFLTGGSGSVNLGAPTIEFEMGYREFCGVEVVPCPDYAVADALDDLLEDYRFEQFEFVQEIVATVPETTINVASDTFAAIFEIILSQLEIASIAYVVYQSVSLWFPSPLFLFRSPILVALRRFVFGAQKLYFMATLLAIWWGAAYVRTFNIPAIGVHLANFLRDPCLANPEHFLQVGAQVSFVCDELIEMETDWKVQTETINQILPMVELMHECECDFPFLHLRQLMPTIPAVVDQVTALGFGRSAFGGLCRGSNDLSCLVLDENPEFLGNTTVCNDPSYARDQLFDLEGASYLSFFDVWISSGLLAPFLIRLAVTNFGIAVLRLADPLSICGGKYEGPPGNYDFGGPVQFRILRMLKEKRLVLAARAQVLVWGVFTLVFAINIWVSSSGDASLDAETARLDRIRGSALLALSLVPLIICTLATRRVNRSLKQIADKETFPEEP